MLPRLGLEAQDSAPASDVARTRTRTAELLEPRGRPEVVLPAEAAAQTPARETLVEPSSRFDQAIATAAQARPSVKDVAALIQAGPADVAASTPASVDSGASAPAHVAASLAAPPSATGSAATSAAASSTHHPQQPLDTRADRWQDALASRIQWLVDHDVGEARIKLNPPELGALDVRVSLLDDKTFVQMTAHAATARDELVQSLPRLRELLTAGGLDLGGATVTGGRDERASQHAALEPLTRAARFAEAAHEAPTERAGALVARAVSRIDTFA
jgi:flagellar hook-length control protein FliK